METYFKQDKCHYIQHEQFMWLPQACWTKFLPLAWFEKVGSLPLNQPFAASILYFPSVETQMRGHYLHTQTFFQQ